MAMNAWRVGFCLGLVAFVAIPVLMPFRGFRDPAAWEWTPADLEHLTQVAYNTFMLSAATLGLSVPAGIALAVLLFRTSFFLRRFLQFLLALALFVPLPVIVFSWQGMLGTSAQPWATGMGPAIWIHALWALPWVAFIVGLGLTWVEPELEEEASQSVDAWRVLALVALPRARASVLAASLFVVLQTAAETNVTDIMQVPTLAEKMREQFVKNDRAGLGRTLVLSLPSLLLTWAAVLAILAYLERGLPPMMPPLRTPRPLELEYSGTRFAVAFRLISLLLVPLFGLVWKLGLTGHPRHWDAGVAWHYLQVESSVKGKDLFVTLATSLGAGSLVAVLALIGCWLGRDRAWFRWILFSVLTWAWVLPGPAIGIGLHDVIMEIVARSPCGILTKLLYYGPSPLPLMWVQAIRALPIAVVFLWPVVRMIPREWFEEARLGGAGPVSEFLHVVLPMTWRAAAVTALATSALCLGEVAASGRVDTPGWMPFTMMLLNNLHTGVENTVAALSLLMLGSLVGLGVVATMIRRFVSR